MCTCVSVYSFVHECLCLCTRVACLEGMRGKGGLEKEGVA